MQNIVFDKPYEFIPPYAGTWWYDLIARMRLYESYLRRAEGVVSHECRGVDHLRASLAAGYGILLTPNHCRTADPLALGWLGTEAGCRLYAVASWHLFQQGAFYRWALRRMGAFSIYREGVDRQAIQASVDILEAAERPLVIFPEGGTTRTNDRLHSLLDGVAFIARAGAKKRLKRDPSSKVVVHPVAIKYLFRGDLIAAVDPVLTEIEQRLSWRPQRHLPLLERIGKLGGALLSLKEVEYLGRTQTGSLASRLTQLIEHLLQPLEQEYYGRVQSGSVMHRVKALRMKILPAMVREEVEPIERERRWTQLAQLYLVQQIACYPPDYLVERRSVDRVLETVERFEEDLTDRVRVHGSLHAIIEVDEAIDVEPDRDRAVAQDPLMVAIEQRLQKMLDRLALESPLVASAPPGNGDAAVTQDATRTA